MISSLKTWSSQGQLTLIVEASAASFIPELSFEWSSPDASLSLLCEMCGSHQGKLSLKSNELSDSAGEFHIIFDTSSARQNRGKHPSNAKGHSASLERGYTIDLSSCFWFACPMQLLPLARARQCLDGHHGIVMDWVRSNLE